jgi:hypothetical protein
VAGEADRAGHAAAQLRPAGRDPPAAGLDAAADRLLNSYLGGTGLTAGDKCICIVDSAGTAQRLEALPRARGEPGPFDGQLDIHLPESSYLADGEFTTSDMLTFWTENMVKADTPAAEANDDTVRSIGVRPECANASQDDLQAPAGRRGNRGEGHKIIKCFGPIEC